jgi:hypothetical protein
MPPLRTPLGASDGNRVRGKEYSPYIRGQIIRASRAGIREVSIKREFRVSRGGIKSTIGYKLSRLDGTTQPRIRAPKTYTQRDRRIMLRNLRLYPKLSFNKRRTATGLKCGNT